MKGGKLYKIGLNRLDFSHPNDESKIPFFKKVAYDLVNNPKAKYKKIERKQKSVQ
jgi:hypothetical protein